MKFSKTILLFLLISCVQKHRHQDIIKDVDEIITINFNNDTLTTSYTDNKTIEMFKEIINGRQENVKPSSYHGQVQFLIKGKIVLTTTITGTGCKYVLNNDTFTTRLTYRVGQFWVGN